MTQTLTNREEAKLLGEVKEAVDLVDVQGMAPDAALEKKARECQWTRGALRSAVHAFNNGRQVAQWRANDNLLDKLAEFPLADYDQIAKAIWGVTVKEAADAYQRQQVDPEYSRPPTWLPKLTQVLPNLEKAAGDTFETFSKVAALALPAEHAALIADHVGGERMRKALGNQQRAKFAFDEQRQKYAAAHDTLRVRLRMLENYFSKSALDRLSFAVVEDAAGTYYGKHGTALFGLLARSLPHEKRAADSRTFLDRPLNPEAPPLSYIPLAIKAAQDVARTKQALDEAYTALEKVAEEQIRPFAGSPSLKTTDPLSISLIKEAGIEDFAGGLGTGTKALLDDALGGDKTRDEVTKTWLDLESPEHENELRKIRVQAMLTSMMSDPENPLSKHDPEHVLKNYNEVSQAAPRIAEQPALIQPHLLKRLSGRAEPFEGKELVDTEKSLMQTRTNTPDTELLGNAPDAILG